MGQPCGTATPLAATATATATGGAGSGAGVPGASVTPTAGFVIGADLPQTGTNPSLITGLGVGALLLGFALLAVVAASRFKIVRR